MFEQQVLAFITGPFTLIFDPDPVTMLACCLVLGCSVSSFFYRRQEQDKFQTPIFLLVIAVAALGWGLGINSNIIMLVLVPLGLCFTMVFSSIVHWLLDRSCRCKCCYVSGTDSKEGAWGLELTRSFVHPATLV